MGAVTRAGPLWPRVLRLRGDDLGPSPSEGHVLTSLGVYSLTPSLQYFWMSALSLSPVNTSI